MFNLFRKKRTQPKSDVEIPGYAPFSGITQKDYTVPICLMVFETKVEEQIKTFLANAHPDEYNGDFLDRVVNSIEEEGLAELSVQKTNHESTIRGLTAQFGGDLIKCDRRIEGLQDRIEAAKADLSEYDAIYKKYNRPVAG